MGCRALGPSALACPSTGAAATHQPAAGADTIGQLPGLQHRDRTRSAVRRAVWGLKNEHQRFSEAAKAVHAILDFLRCHDASGFTSLHALLISLAACRISVARKVSAATLTWPGLSRMAKGQAFGWRNRKL
jgi:hypothetical protein